MVKSLNMFASVAWPSLAASSVTRKRGFSGFLGDAWTCDDARLLGLDDSWHYTWSASPYQGNKCAGQNVTAEFVPMVAGVGAADSMDTAWVHSKWTEANAKYLLGYNEPDYGNGHSHPHMATPADAAAYWPEVQNLAAKFDPPLILVAPSVASTGETGTTDAWDEDGRSTWLDEFLGNCSEVVKDCDPSLIKYLGFHDYHGSVPMLKRKLDGAVKRYGGRKVWITEIAITDWRDPPARDAQDAYMKELLPYLDSSDNVFRYSWFSARNAPNNQNGGSNLLEADGSAALTSTGKIYATEEVVPTTQPDTTEAPTTHSDTTVAPTTQPETTEAPTTQPETTEDPTSLPETTERPTTQPETTEGPTTQPETTEASTTQPDTTVAPTTQPETTEAPTTVAPTTQPETTEGPTTQPETTEAPTTQPETTAAPTTSPTTQAPPSPALAECHACDTICAPCQDCIQGPDGTFLFGSCDKCWHCWDWEHDKLADKDEKMDKDCDVMHKDHDWDDNEVRCLTDHPKSDKVTSDCRACWGAQLATTEAPTTEPATTEAPTAQPETTEPPETTAAPTPSPWTTKAPPAPAPSACRACQTVCAPCHDCIEGPNGTFMFGSCDKCWHCWDWDDDELEDKDEKMDKDCDVMHKDHDWDDNEVRCLTDHPKSDKITTDCRACWAGLGDAEFVV